MRIALYDILKYLAMNEMIINENTSEPAPWRLIDCLEHGKQNLWFGTDGH